MKLVSLILTTFNCKQNLEKTLESIEGQDYPNLEIVIKDGGSTDGTLDVIRDYEKASRFLVKWVSVEDQGLYDAMNQGLALSTGEIILFFNDRFTGKQVVSKCIHAMEQEGTDGVHGDLVYAEAGEVKRYWKMGTGTIRSGWMPERRNQYPKRRCLRCVCQGSAQGACRKRNKIPMVGSISSYTADNPPVCSGRIFRERSG